MLSWTETACVPFVGSRAPLYSWIRVHVPLTAGIDGETQFTVLENFLVGAELARTVAAVERLKDTPCCNSRGCCALDETFRTLLDHERVLPLVVDAIGWNIQHRDCIFVVSEPNTGAAASPKPGDRTQLGFPWHFDQVGLFSGLTHDGRMPLVVREDDRTCTNASALLSLRIVLAAKHRAEIWLCYQLCRT